MMGMVVMGKVTWNGWSKKALETGSPRSIITAGNLKQISRRPKDSEESEAKSPENNKSQVEPTPSQTGYREVTHEELVALGMPTEDGWTTSPVPRRTKPK